MTHIIELEELKASFKKFLFVLFKYQNLPKPTEAQYAIAEFLESPDKYKLIEAYRGIGKSWITSMYVLWLLLNNPQLEILVVSATGTKAKEFTGFTQKLITSVPFLKDALMPTDFDGKRWSSIAFDVKGKLPAQAPSVKSIGLFGQITGSRADIVIADDIEVKTNSGTVEARERILANTAEFTNVLKNSVEPNVKIGTHMTNSGGIIYLGTPQTEESIYNKLMEGGSQYKALIYPAYYPSDVAKYKGNLAKNIYEKLEQSDSFIGLPSDPDHFDARALDEKKLNITRSDFQLQYLLDTTLSDLERYPLKIHDIIVTDAISATTAPIDMHWGASDTYRIKELESPGFTGDYFRKPSFIDTNERKEYDEILMAIDPSGRGTDETAYCVLGRLFSKLYLLDIDGMKDGYSPDTLAKLANKAAEFNVTRIVVEGNYGGGMFTQLLKPYLYEIKTQVEEVNNYTQKEKRIIDTLGPLIANHRLIASYEVVKRDIEQGFNRDTDTNSYMYSLFYQLTHVTRDRGALKHDDRIDVLTLGCMSFMDLLMLDNEKLVHRAKEKMLANEFDNLFTNRKKRKPTTPRFNDSYSIESSLIETYIKPRS